eukprot:7384816-Prymnesium_polylepis.2
MPDGRTASLCALGEQLARATAVHHGRALHVPAQGRLPAVRELRADTREKALPERAPLRHR